MLTTTGPAARAGAVAAALALGLAAAQPSWLGPLPASADGFREDLALLAGLVSEGAAARAEQVRTAREELARALRGLTVELEATPEARYALDLARGNGGWDAGLEVELGVGAARDEDRVLRAQAALAAAEGRYRAQLRADLRAGLLALSQERLAARTLADAEAAAAEARAAVEEARAAGAGETELAALEVAAGLAAADRLLDLARPAVELERARLGYRTRDAVLAEIGAPRAAREAGAYLLGPVPPGLSRPEQHRERAALAVAAERADLALRRLPFEHLREVELTADYRDGGFAVEAELGLRRGVPTADATFGWSTSEGAPRLRFGVSARLLFSNGSSARPTLVVAERELALTALAEFDAAQPDREREALRLLELAYEELHLLLLSRDAAEAALEAARAQGRDTARLEASLRRADDASERAWQRYVRALFDYLETTDAVLGGT